MSSSHFTYNCAIAQNTTNGDLLVAMAGKNKRIRQAASNEDSASNSRNDSNACQTTTNSVDDVVNDVLAGVSDSTGARTFSG